MRLSPGTFRFTTAYITGSTGSANFPLKNAFQSTSGGKEDAFAAKFNSSGNLLYSTYLGGSVNDQGEGIAVDNSGNAFITGITLSANFPTQNAFQPSIGGSQKKDAFLIEVATGATKPVRLITHPTMPLQPAVSEMLFRSLLNATLSILTSAGLLLSM